MKRADRITMPILFIGHGSPLNAVEDNAFSKAWLDMGRRLPRPSTVLCISAHWQTQGSRVTAMDRPSTLYDFFGFPDKLYTVRYPCNGAPDLARRLQDLLPAGTVQPDFTWGLDHGAWSVLCRLFPAAETPVAQLSLDLNKSPRQHYQLGTALKHLRQ